MSSFTCEVNTEKFLNHRSSVLIREIRGFTCEIEIMKESIDGAPNGGAPVGSDLNSLL
jgi:hypothetical protein